MLVLDAIVVANADTAMAADNEPLLISVAVDTTPQGVQPAPGDSSDRSAPSAPGNLAVMASTETTIDLSWTAATDNTGVSRYRLYRGSKLLATTGGTTYADSDLQSATTYAYSVTAVDDAGNESAAAQLNATTAGNTGPVTPPPATSSGGGSTDMMSLILLLAGWQRRRITRSRRSERPRHTA